MAGEEDAGGLRPAGPHLAYQVDPALPRHLNVAEDEADGGFFQNRKRLGGVIGGQNLPVDPAAFPVDPLHHPADRDPLVVNQQ